MDLFTNFFFRPSTLSGDGAFSFKTRELFYLHSHGGNSARVSGCVEADYKYSANVSPSKTPVTMLKKSVAIR